MKLLGIEKLIFINFVTENNYPLSPSNYNNPTITIIWLIAADA